MTKRQILYLMDSAGDRGDYEAVEKYQQLLLLKQEETNKRH